MTPVIFVVDDDASIRKSLVRLLTSTGYRVEAFASAQEFLACEPSPGGPCCLVLDVRMPGVTGLDLQRTLATAAHRIPIVFITGHGDISMGVTAMKAGAVDFLLKPVEDQQLLATISQALARHAAQRKLARERDQCNARLARLSAREREVMESVIAGRLNKQIAYDLGISEKTVKAHRGRVMEKVEVRSVAELVRVCEVAGVPPRSNEPNRGTVSAA